MGEGYIQRADLQRLEEVFTKYASVTEGGEKYLTYEDFVVRFLGLLPEKEYNKETLALFGGILDQGKDGAELISFNEFVSFEAHLCKPDALYRAAFQLFDRLSFFNKFDSFLNKNILTGTEEDLWDSQSSLPSCREPVCTSWLKINIDDH